LSTPGSGVTDIDGNTYPTVIFNGREFMAENLRVSRFNNGDLISQDFNILNYDTIPNWSSFDYNTQNDLIYGKFYNCYAVSDNRNVCPVNWHVARDDEWTKTFFSLLKIFRN
jgi:uncharacterized protein (TIGR02145 family)